MTAVTGCEADICMAGCYGDYLIYIPIERWQLNSRLVDRIGSTSLAKEIAERAEGNT